MNKLEIDSRFRLDQSSSLESKFIEMAVAIDFFCRESREKTIAMERLEDSLLWTQRCLVEVFQPKVDKHE